MTERLHAVKYHPFEGYMILMIRKAYQTPNELKGDLGTDTATQAGEAQKRTGNGDGDGWKAAAWGWGWRLALVIALVVTTRAAAYLLGDAPTANGALVAVGGELLALVGLGAYALAYREYAAALVLRHLEVLRTRKEGK